MAAAASGRGGGPDTGSRREIVRDGGNRFVVAMARIVWKRSGDAARAGRGMKVELVERARAGDHEAFSELARASFGRLYGVAKLILRDQDRAQDAVQEALVLAWKNIRAIRDPEAWDAWLYRLTVRACYRLARSARRRAVVELHVELDDEPSNHDFTTPLAERDRLGRELGRLPVDQRAVMVLHFFVDLPLTEVATVLDIPAGTAKSRLHRGLETLRAALTENGAGVAATSRERPA
jgi:RNA polymerase sigma factor (sigma-70 family)